MQRPRGGGCAGESSRLLQLVRMLVMSTSAGGRKSDWMYYQGYIESYGEYIKRGVNVARAREKNGKLVRSCARTHTQTYIHTHSSTRLPPLVTGPSFSSVSRFVPDFMSGLGSERTVLECTIGTLERNKTGTNRQEQTGKPIRSGERANTQTYKHTHTSTEATRPFWAFDMRPLVTGAS